MEGLIQLFSQPEVWAALFTLIVMEVVLGIDNLIFISILSNKLPADQRQKARRIGIVAKVANGGEARSKRLHPVHLRLIGMQRRIVPHIGQQSLLSTTVG